MRLDGHRFAPEATTIAPLTPTAASISTRWPISSRRGDGAPMLALQGANNETGVLQPVAEAAALVHAAGGILVCDAVQLAGRADLAAAAADADFVILSAHKFGGPKGAGALIAMRPELAVGAPLVRGGGQERGMRAGTENVAAIAGFGAAARVAAAEAVREASRLSGLRDRLAERVLGLAPEATIFGSAAPRLPNTLAFSVPGVAAATLVIALDLAGVAVSSGSACSSGKVKPSHVLEAMGVAPSLAAGAIRLSLGWGSSEADVERFGSALAAALTGLRKRRGTVEFAETLVARPRPADA